MWGRRKEGANPRPSGDGDHRQARGRIWFAANLYGPVNGQVVANRKILALLQSRSAPVIMPLGAGGGGKVLAALRLTVAALFSSSDDRVYLSLPGQRGGWLIIPALLIFRLIGARLFLHHHSYRALGAGPTPLGRALARAAGRDTTHILLSPSMASAFAARYGRPGDAKPVALSNAALLEPPPAPAPRTGPVTIGFLGVWTAEKGLDYALRLAERLLARETDMHFAIAGAPRRDNDPIVADVSALAARWPGRFMVNGWLDGPEKTAFLTRLDCLLLPSRLPDEAEPLTMLEAFSAGVDVMAAPLGAIPERISSPDRLLTLDLDADLDRIVRIIAARRGDRHAAALACRDHALRLHRASAPSLDHVLAQLEPQARAASAARPRFAGSASS